MPVTPAENGLEDDGTHNGVVDHAGWGIVFSLKLNPRSALIALYKRNRNLGLRLGGV
jgi:hypothetical protein